MTAIVPAEVFALEASQVEKACAAVAVLPVTNQTELDALGAGLKESSARLKWIEDYRTTRTAAPLAEVERLRSETRAAEAAYKKLKAAIVARTVRYHQEQRAAEDKARKEALAVQEHAHAAAAAGNLPAAQALQGRAFQAMQTAPDALAAEGVHTRKEWRIRVVDAALVPRNLCVPDEALILETIRAALPKAADVRGVVPPFTKATWEQAGVEIYLHETAIAR